MQTLQLPSHIQIAQYTPQLRHDRYAGNKLVEALPPPLDEVEVMESLQFLPDFDPNARSWERSDRLRELLRLMNLMVPLSSSIELSLAIDSMMREGYVGRKPQSTEHMAIYQEIHDDSLKPKAFRQSHDTLVPKLSTALVGIPGMGKTTTVQRCLARYPRVIYHPELDLYQIPWLHFEMPSDGRGVKSLLTSIIEAIAELIPNNTYSQDYVRQSRESESSMQSSVRRLLNKHCVGLLIPDEVQNVANTRKSDQVVMTELTTLANKSRTPVLYIGTPKANRVLGLDLRQGRRSIGLSLGDWNALPRYDILPDEDGVLVQQPGEWVDFVTTIWEYSWVRNPVPLSQGLLDAIYYCTQGIIDLALKLFMVAQARAILDGTETISEQLLMSVYEQQFKLVHPMLQALRENNHGAMSSFDDMPSLDVEDAINDLSRRHRVSTARGVTVRPGVPGFASQLAHVGKAIGLEAADAQALANQVAEDGTAKNMLDAVSQLAKKAAPPPRAKATKGTRAASDPSNAELPSYPGIEQRPDDFRNAIVGAAVEKTSVFEQLVRLKMIPEVEDVICLA